MHTHNHSLKFGALRPNSSRALAPRLITAAFVLAAPFLISSTALAADNEWKGADKKWRDKANWDLGHVPKAGETAVVKKGSPQVDAKIDPKPLILRIGGLMTATPKVAITGNGELEVSSILLLGRDAKAAGAPAGLEDKREHGDLFMKGKLLTVGAVEVGRAGVGRIDHEGGTIKVTNSIMLGKDKGSRGTWRIDGGDVEAKNAVVGKTGVGDLTHRKGNFTLTSEEDALSVAVNDISEASAFHVGGGKFVVKGKSTFGTKGKANVSFIDGEVTLTKELRTAVEEKGECDWIASFAKLTVEGDAFFGGLGKTKAIFRGNGAEWTFKKSFVLSDGKSATARTLEIGGTSKLVVDGPFVIGRRGIAEAKIKGGDHKFNDDLILAELKDSQATLEFIEGKVTVAQNLRIGNADGSETGKATLDLGEDVAGEAKAELSVTKDLVGATGKTFEVILRNPKTFKVGGGLKLEKLKKFAIKGKAKVKKKENFAPADGPFVSMADGASIDPGLEEAPFGLLEFEGTGELNDTLVICDIGMPIVEFDAEGGLEKHTEPGVTHDAVIFDESVTLDQQSVADGSTIAVIFNPPVSGIEDERFGVPYDLFFASALDGTFNVEAFDLPPGLGLKVEQFDGLVRVTLSNEFAAAQP